MSYAIITLGGKQYRVQEGERLLVDHLKADKGKTFNPKVLLTGGNGKTDLAPSITVTARVVSHELGEKIRIGKYKKRTGYRKHARLPLEPDADRDRVDRRGRAQGGGCGQAESRAEGRDEAEGGAHAEGGGAGCSSGAHRSSAEGLRGHDRRRDRGRGAPRLAPPEPRGSARVRARECKAQGSDRRARPRLQTRRATNGTSRKVCGSSRNGRDSNPQMLGVKMFGARTCRPG